MGIELFVAVMRFLYNGQRADYQGPIGLCHYREGTDRSRWIFVPHFPALVVVVRSRSAKYRLTANIAVNLINRSCVAFDDQPSDRLRWFLVEGKNNFKLARYCIKIRATISSSLSNHYSTFAFIIARIIIEPCVTDKLRWRRKEKLKIDWKLGRN